MSITQYISTLPDTKRTLDDSVNYSYLEGYFVTEKRYLFTESNITNPDTWNNYLESNDLTPLHYVKQVEHVNEETQYADSIRDKTYKLRAGKYKQRARYNFSIDRHSLVNELSGTDLYIIPYDRNGNVYVVNDSSGIRGIKTTRIELEKMLFPTDSEPAFSVLDIEFDEQFNDVINLGFNPKDIDRLFVSINILLATSSFINFTVKRNGENITGLSASDITLTDLLNGNITGIFLNYQNGVYTINSFSSPVTNGILTIVSSLYIGCTKYNVVIVVEVNNSMTFGSGDNMIFGSGDNMRFGN